MRENERYGLEGVKDEVAGMVWREDMNLARPMEVLDFEGIMMPRPVQRLTGMVEGMVEAVGAVGNVVVVEMELDSASNMDRDVNLIPNSVIVVPSNFDENLTIVPIEQTATIPLHSVVPQVIQCPSEVVVSGGVSSKGGSLGSKVWGRGRSAYWRKVNPTKSRKSTVRKNITVPSSPKVPANTASNSCGNSLDSLKNPRLKRILGLNLDPKQHSTPLQATKNVEISSDSSSGPVESTASIKETHINCHEEDEVAKAICLERDPSIEVLSWNNERRNLGEEDLAGIANSAELSKHFNLGAVSPPRDCNATTANSLGRAVEDLNHMGFHNSQLLQISQSENDDQDISNEQIQDGPPNWVEQVDILNNSVIDNPPSVESTLHPFHPWTSLNFPLEHHPKSKNDMVPLQRFKANI
ncbi:hypothetical protein V6N11_013631 [Hibiscus sabdariffa]|uniref:Uncharacterized protein n=1 Tax=Hibiscus sabdariffa TaxID=183260 RepID=A0ABR1ZYX0_9ROSI